MLKTGLRIRRKQPGLAPGTLVYEGEAPPGPIHIQVFDYDATTFEERTLPDLEACAAYRDRNTVTWVNVDGVHDVRQVAEIGRLFDIHPLTLEDIVHTRQRPKMEEYPHYVYVALQMMHYEHQTCTLEAEQVSLVIGRGFVISFQEAKTGDVFDPVRQRLREARGRIRTSGADYLAYALIDVAVDFYMDILEGLGEHIEQLETDVTTDPEPAHLQQINKLRRHTLLLRRSIWPLRDVITALERSELPFMSPETDVFYRDVYDHTIRTAELIESSREVLASMVELYLSTVSYRMNEIMKVLAIISTFFLPLTFVAGIYGMNFNPEASPFNMPELNWVYGYPFALGLMGLIALGMLFFFRRKRWL